MAFHIDGGTPSLQECLDYAIRLGEDVAVMLDRKTKRYHCIRRYGVEHWLKHYDLIANVKPVMTVEFVSKE